MFCGTELASVVSGIVNWASSSLNGRGKVNWLGGLSCANSKATTCFPIPRSVPPLLLEYSSLFSVQLDKITCDCATIGILIKPADYKNKLLCEFI